MIRYITAILFVVAFAGQTFQQGLVVLSYYANATSFEKHCENKARPAMHCNGKCQMMKKLQEENKQQEQTPERKPVNKEDQLSSNSSFIVLPLLITDLRLPFRNSSTGFLPQNYCNGVFRPPATA